MKKLIALLALVAVLFPSAAIAQQTVATPTTDDGRAVIAWAAPQIDGYYRTLFALMGQEYHPPKMTIADPAQKVSTGCGIATGEMMAFYCPADEQIVIGTDVLAWTAGLDDFAPTYVLSHEWAHHAQKLSGTDSVYVPKDGDWNQVYTVENELRADCMAGSWMQNVAHRGYLDATDMSAVLLLASQIGDTGLFGRTTSHGLGVERLRAVLTGYEHGVIACMAITPMPRETGS